MRPRPAGLLRPVVAPAQHPTPKNEQAAGFWGISGAGGPWHRAKAGATGKAAATPLLVLSPAGNREAHRGQQRRLDADLWPLHQQGGGADQKAERVAAQTAALIWPEGLNPATYSSLRVQRVGRD
jgi:hypothetical protein